MIRFFGGPMDGKVVGRIVRNRDVVVLLGLREMSRLFPGYRIDLDGRAEWIT